MAAEEKHHRHDRAKGEITRLGRASPTECRRAHAEQRDRRSARYGRPSARSTMGDPAVVKPATQCLRAATTAVTTSGISTKRPSLYGSRARTRSSSLVGKSSFFIVGRASSVTWVTKVARLSSPPNHHLRDWPLRSQPSSDPAFFERRRRDLRRHSVSTANPTSTGRGPVRRPPTSAKRSGF